MAEHIFELPAVHFNTRKLPKDAANNYAHAIRCYRYSPDRVLLQIRGAKSYISVTLPFDIATAIADALKTEVAS